jgi:hypothetical protein
MSDKEKYGGKVWFVRGVPAELRAEVATAAERAGMKVGAWVERALRAALEQPDDVGRGPGDAAGDLAARVADLAATVEAVRTLFEKHRRQDFPSIVERLERLEAQAVPAIPEPAGRALDAVEPVGGVKVPEMAETHPGASQRPGRRSPRKWTDADDAELRRIFDRGDTRADACREMDRPNSVISRKWATLLEERANRTLPSIELVRQADEMLKAGRPTAEISEALSPKEGTDDQTPDE